MSRSWAAALGRVLDVIGRPVRRPAGRAGLVLQPYRGYGTAEEAFLIGRVFQQPTLGVPRPKSGIVRHLVELGRRFLRRGVGGAQLVARFYGAEHRVTSDRDGYFRVHMRPGRPPPADRRWHDMEIELVHPKSAAATGEIFVPPDGCRYLVISDIDDTVMHTGVASRLMMLWRLFMRGPRSRVAFPGMAAFLGALHRGRSGAECNPMLYVSRAPWSIYEVLDAFFRLHAIPVGPILFLREWGLTLQRPLPRRAEGHKLHLIRHMLEMYRDLPVILVGDSGQHDPEIYARIVHEHPERVQAIYIRKVTSDSDRHRAIEALGAEVLASGASLLLAADAFAMAEHAAERGFVSAEALDAVLREKALQESEPESGHARARPTRRLADEGALQDALAEDDGGSPARNVAVAPREKQGAP